MRLTRPFLQACPLLQTLVVTYTERILPRIVQMLSSTKVSILGREAVIVIAKGNPLYTCSKHVEKPLNVKAWVASLCSRSLLETLSVRIQVQIEVHDLIFWLVYKDKSITTV